MPARAKTHGERIRGGQERVKRSSAKEAAVNKDKDQDFRCGLNFKDTKLEGNVNSSRHVGAPHLMEIRPVSHLFITNRFICFPSRPYNPGCIHTCITLVKAVIITTRKGIKAEKEASK